MSVLLFCSHVVPHVCYAVELFVEFTVLLQCVNCTQIRKDYYDENIKAGPQSRILEGVTWDEAQKIRVSDVL